MGKLKLYEDDTTIQYIDNAVGVAHKEHLFRNETHR